MRIKHMLLGLTAALAIAGCQQEAAKEQAAVQDKDPTGEVVARVNDEPITKRMYEFHIARRMGGAPQMATPEQREALLQELIDITLLAQQAKQNGLADKDEVVEQLRSARNAVLAHAAVDAIREEQPDDAALQAKYDKEFGDARTEYHARHILVEEQATAEKLITELNDGADFAKLAEENSTGPSNGQGGDLGWFELEQMIPAFSQAVQALEPGTYTKAPVQTEFGWHVIKLEETRPMTPPSMDEVRDHLVGMISQERLQSRLEELRKQANVTMVQPPVEEMAPVAQEQPKPEAEQAQQADPQPQNQEQSAAQPQAESQTQAN